MKKYERRVEKLTQQIQEAAKKMEEKKKEGDIEGAKEAKSQKDKANQQMGPATRELEEIKKNATEMRECVKEIYKRVRGKEARRIEEEEEEEKKKEGGIGEKYEVEKEMKE